MRIFRPVFDAADLKTDGSDFDHLFKDGEHFKVGELEAEVIYTPGHTPADITYKIEHAAFVGDTLFNGTRRFSRRRRSSTVPVRSEN